MFRGDSNTRRCFKETSCFVGRNKELFSVGSEVLTAVITKNTFSLVLHRVVQRTPDVFKVQLQPTGLFSPVKMEAIYSSETPVSLRL
jgi:hypothetical protein